MRCIQDHHYLVQNVVAKLFNGTDAASVCFFYWPRSVLLFYKNEKVWDSFPLAGQMLEQQEEPFLRVHKNEFKHNHVFLGGIVENSSWNLWRISSLR